MADMNSLISTDQLHTSLIHELAETGRLQTNLFYDPDFDALMLLLVPNDRETIVHYVDDHVALLVLQEELEVVGLQIEDFRQSFLPSHATVQQVWRLNDTGATLKDFGDLMLTFETLTPRIAREVVKATETLLGEPGADLVAALA